MLDRQVNNGLKVFTRIEKRESLFLDIVGINFIIIVVDLHRITNKNILPDMKTVIIFFLSVHIVQKTSIIFHRPIPLVSHDLNEIFN
ncbi:hypothetical protein EFP18_08930 [Burkholderia glumae]|nr:hypothetical protein DF052_24945 [Burkholderia glumae]UVS84263.1 hypothetical protein EFP18_08930 [Burkholderia glumae]